MRDRAPSARVGRGARRLPEQAHVAQLDERRAHREPGRGRDQAPGTKRRAPERHPEDCAEERGEDALQEHPQRSGQDPQGYDQRALGDVQEDAQLQEAVRVLMKKDGRDIRDVAAYQHVLKIGFDDEKTAKGAGADK